MAERYRLGSPVRVARTGLAVVDEGEVISAATDSTADLVAIDDATVVEYHFPVEIDVRAGAPDVDAEAIAQLVLQRLAEGLASA